MCGSSQGSHEGSFVTGGFYLANKFMGGITVNNCHHFRLLWFSYVSVCLKNIARQNTL